MMVGEGLAPIRGALPDYIMRTIAPHTGMRFEWLAPMTLQRAMQLLRDGKMDIALLVSGAKGADRGFARFDWTYLQAQPYLAVKPASPIQSVPSLAALADLEIGWVGGSVLPEELQPLRIRWQYVHAPNWQRINLHKLAAGRIQAAYFGNEFSAAYFARKENLAVRLVRLPIANQPFEMAYSLKSDKQAIAEFDKLARAAFKDDQFRAFLASYRD